MANGASLVRTRRLARRLALDVLYEAEIRDLLPLEAFDARAGKGWKVAPAEGDDPTEPSPETLAYARAVVAGVQAHRADIDAMIASYADRWAIARMPVIDRSLLRMGVFELLWGEGVPVAVVINEAVEMAKKMSTDDSGRFINGLLGRIVEERDGPPTPAGN
jgi:N utilization substance protein B